MRYIIAPKSLLLNSDGYIINHISAALAAAQTVKHDKFSSTKSVRTTITATTTAVDNARVLLCEYVAHGAFLTLVKPLELAVVKDECVSRTIAALVFSPNMVSSVASLKKIRRELNSYHANGCMDTVRKVMAWKYKSPFLQYAKSFILAYDLEYDSSEDCVK